MPQPATRRQGTAMTHKAPCPICAGLWSPLPCPYTEMKQPGTGEQVQHQETSKGNTK
jgi:hypothetical protein